MLMFTDEGAIYRADNGRLHDVSYIFDTPLGDQFRQWKKKKNVDAATTFYRRAYSFAASRWIERESGVYAIDYAFHRFEATRDADGNWSVKCVFTDTRSEIPVDEILPHALLACYIREHNGWFTPRPARPQPRYAPRYGGGTGYATRRPYYGRTAMWGTGRRAGR